MGSACSGTSQTRQVVSSNRGNYEKIHRQSFLRNNEYEKVIDSFKLISPNSSWPELKILHCKLQQDQAKTRSQKSSALDLKEDIAGIWESINTSELMQGLEDEDQQPQGQLKDDQVGIRKFVCEACGGLCLFPCVTCNGSCKILEGRTPEGSISVCRCPDCNEDGLIQCPLCSKFEDPYPDPG